MKIINKKYHALKPNLDYLTDEIIIAQAWKKTHGYIRAFNWYADTLALDISALTIEENAKVWAKSIEELRPLNELELVPAAKSEKWDINEKGWNPPGKREKGKLPLRPLAHITIRDQTWASAIMLCLADAVETAQGDCSHQQQTYSQAREKGVFSYGNRLVCEWKNQKAWFRWGNSNTYRKFFSDYQNFLKRPFELGREALNSGDSNNIFIVNLDLKQFFNNIEIPLLIKRLKKISKEFGHEVDDKFWLSVEHVFGWRWSDDAKLVSEYLGLGKLDGGIPQGLVAAGFLANAYLLDFDKALGEKIGSTIPLSNEKLLLIDYCRYVDDLRLVVSTDNITIAEIKELLNKWISKLLKMSAGESLQLNDSKTKVNQLDDLDNNNSLTNRIRTLQNDLSGPTDRDSLNAITGILESFLTIENTSLNNIDSSLDDFDLLSLANFDHDVRPDTLKRFAANRIESIVKSKRRIAEISNSDRAEAENELLAKKLIFAWMKDPSLGLVLRKAMEVYPSADLFEPVFDSIYRKSSFSTDKDIITAAMMDFLIADIFRSCSDFNGYFQLITYPESINPKSLIELATKHAQKVVSKVNCAPFVRRQALMLLAISNKPILDTTSHESIQKDLHNILVNNPPEYQPQRSVLFEVAGQITGNNDNFACMLLEIISHLNKEKQVDALSIFAKRGGLFWDSIWKQLKKRKERNLIENLSWASPLNGIEVKANSQNLARIIASSNNGFAYEHGAIKLALALIELAKYNLKCLELSPKQLRVKLLGVNNWNEVWHEEAKIDYVKIDSSYKVNDPRFVTPSWIYQDSLGENKIIYWIGSILRSAVLGGTDFTGTQIIKSKTITYKGLKTNWYKRRMGMFHSPESLVGNFATISNWFSDLMMRCLQWPGFESSYIQTSDIKGIIDLNSLKTCLTNRLDKLNHLICKLSMLPTIPTEVRRNSNRTSFRIVTVQQLLPLSTDFGLADITLDNPSIRAKHREHLISICSLIVKTLETKGHAEGSMKPFADLIVFPEVAIHINDQDIIKRLADKTGAMIFAGLVFQEYSGNLLNIARWIIPDYRESGRQWIIRDQGKHHMNANEKQLGIFPFRPCQHFIEVYGDDEGPFIITGAICYDATDIKLAADLRDKTDLFVIVAHNKDVATFDNMASALHWHMYQHVVIANIGEFGGSTIQAPYKQPFDKLISHAHGVGQISISMADLDLAAFRRKINKYREVKSKPAGLDR